jgi:DNA topoisomerase I
MATTTTKAKSTTKKTTTSNSESPRGGKVKSAKTSTSSWTKTSKTTTKYVSKWIDTIGMNGSTLVIVESPTKAKTITKFLGKDYDIVASMWHITELVDRNMANLVANKFEAEYGVAEGKENIVRDLKKLIKTHPKVILATDEDREWEAISRHLCQLLGLDPVITPRIVFHEITKSAIEHAIAEPRTIDMNLVWSQKSRAVLDKLVWFTISPVLWSKLKSWLSAGRVQSVATKLVVEREELINAFDAKEYWTIAAQLKVKSEKLQVEFDIKLQKVGVGWVSEEENSSEEESDEGEALKLGNGRFDKATVDKVFEQLNLSPSPVGRGLGWGQNDPEKSEKGSEKSENKKGTQLISYDSVSFVLKDIQKKKTSGNPGIPFITSSLQQTASRMFGWPVKTVMQTAQKLYEQWFITYMRTDSPNLSQQSIDAIGEYVKNNFGAKYHQSRQFASKSKNAQEAHEAIRPTDPKRTPEQVRLWQYENKLYELIWARTVASQMSPAQFQQTTYQWQPSVSDQQQWMCQGKVMEFDGYLRVYMYADRDDVVLPLLEVGTEISSSELSATQNYTKAPARYTEATLVKKMETLWIGRPSTYASIIQTIQDRLYVIKDQQKLKPTEIAFWVTKFLEQHFIDLMNYQFTAKLEDDLDGVAEGAVDRQKMLTDFWTGFEPHIESAKEADRIQMLTGKPCPKCWQWELVTKFAKSGSSFYGCNRYPECDYISETDDAEAKLFPLREKYEGKPCPAGGTMVVRIGRFWPFLSSSLYPDVKWIKSISAYENELLSKDYAKPCPKCGKWTMVVKSSRRGKFLSCDRYPDCANTENLPKDNEENEEK